MILDTIHVMGFVVLIVYASVIFSVIENIKDSFQLTGGEIRWWVWIFNMALLLQAGMFMYLQTDWILNNYDSVIEDVTATMWAVYDWSNGVALLA